ncbi:hypothetical protein PsYK624_000690 [Phanerochaete sordida]|uniref:Uncharacterized protein n=1 Tax=Phanerochaete sordida TaxID=48140 RepID=A0A9P3L6L6_9APHY|nr:hypothetical protein PsYK624_000690 [Phanerochaete sordida]
MWPPQGSGTVDVTRTLPRSTSSPGPYPAQSTLLVMYPPSTAATPTFSYPPTPIDDAVDLSKLFPHIDSETFGAILRHDFPAAELYKLDTRRILEAQWHMIDLEDSTISYRAIPSAREIYQTLDSLVVPLNIYFSILCVHALSNGQPPTLPYYFFKYSSHLIKIVQQYEWHAVLLYHFAFFARRCTEMLQGNYAGWEKIDVDLMEELLVQHRKQPEESSNGKRRTR